MTVREYLTPRSLPEALELRARHGSDLVVMAGGTLVMPLLNEGALIPERVMGLRRAGLDGIRRADGATEIGATTTLTQLVAQGDVPLLREAAGRTAAWAVRNHATVGGNLFAPAPLGDVAVALLALDASVRIASPAAERVVPLTAFHPGDGAALAPDELVVGLSVPTATRETAYLKLGRKAANTPAIVTVAIALDRRDGVVSDARVALGAVAPRPVRSSGAEAVLRGSALDEASIGRAAEAAVEDGDPSDDAVASAWYRRRMIGVAVRRALASLVADTQRPAERVA